VFYEAVLRRAKRARGGQAGWDGRTVRATLPAWRKIKRGRGGAGRGSGTGAPASARRARWATLRKWRPAGEVASTAYPAPRGRAAARGQCRLTAQRATAGLVLTKRACDTIGRGLSELGNVKSSGGVWPPVRFSKHWRTWPWISANDVLGHGLDRFRRTRAAASRALRFLGLAFWALSWSWRDVVGVWLCF